MPKPTIDIKLDDPRTITKALKQLNKTRGRVKRIRPLFQRIASDIDRLYLRQLRADLQEYPSPRYKLKPHFSSKKQHDYVMFMWRTRKIQLPTQRSDELAKSWQVKTNVTDTGIDLTIDTTDEKAQYVVGKVGISQKKSDIKKYESPIQPFAKANRWRPAHTVVTPVVLRARKYAVKQLEEWEVHLYDERDFHG